MARTAPLTHSQALYVIDRLVAERKVSPAMVVKIRDEMASEIRDLEERLARLRGGTEANRPARTTGNGTAASAGKTLSAATQASRRLQGQYLNLIRRVPAAQRARYKQLAQTKGREEAVKALRKTLKSA